MFRGYEVEGQIGSGATGVVWLANQIDVDRKVAIKQLAPALAGDEGFRARFRAEARVLASLTDPNVVMVYDYVEGGDDAPYIVEEWVDGAALDRVVAAAGRLTGEQAIGVLRGALMGLAAAHGAGLVHGDVSTTNILVDMGGTSKLIDFGLASPSGRESSSGTPSYASPEALQGRALSARSDVYSAGCVLFELLAGHAPYRAESIDALAALHLTAAVPALPGSNGQTAVVVARALAKDPADRYPDAAAFLAALLESAQRDLGAGWLAGASLAGLAIGARSVAAAGAGPPTATATVTTSATGRASNISKFAARRKVPLVAAGAAAAVVIVAIVAGAGGGGHKQAAPLSVSDPAKAAAIARDNNGAAVPSSPGAFATAETQPGLPMTIKTSSYSGRVRDEPKDPPKVLRFRCEAKGCVVYEGFVSGPIVGDRAHFSGTYQNGGCRLTTAVVDLRVTSWTTRSGVRVPAAVAGTVDEKLAEGPRPACGGAHYRYEGTSSVAGA